MASKVTTAVAGLIVGLVFLVGATQGCDSSPSNSLGGAGKSGAAGTSGAAGASGGGADIAMLCASLCTKKSDCGLLFGPEADCKTECAAASGGNGTRCTNEAALVTAVNACIAMANCDSAAACIGNDVPACAGGGAAGSAP